MVKDSKRSTAPNAFIAQRTAERQSQLINTASRMSYFQFYLHREHTGKADSYSRAADLAKIAFLLSPQFCLSMCHVRSFLLISSTQTAISDVSSIISIMFRSRLGAGLGGGIEVGLASAIISCRCRAWLASTSCVCNLRLLKSLSNREVLLGCSVPKIGRAHV